MTRSLPLVLVAACGLLAHCGAKSAPAEAEVAGDAAGGSDATTGDAAADTGPPFVLDPKLDPWTAEPAGATARYDLAAADWHATPFPTNSRRAADGDIDLSGFPAARGAESSELLNDYLKYADGHLRGWSIQPTIYVQFSAPLDLAAFHPPTAQPTQDAMFLMDVTPESPEYGLLIPLTAHATGPERGVYQVENLLAAQPVWGRPLRPETTYAFVLRRGVKDKAGLPLGRPLALASVIDARLEQKDVSKLDPASAKWASALEPLFKAMEAGKIHVQPKDIAAATVLTTGRPTAQLEAMAAWVREKSTTQTAFGFERIDTKDPDFVLASASYTAPNFQSGTCPYTTPGEGGFDLAADGSPTVQRTETMRVLLMLPKNPLIINGKVPVVESAHGTGGDWMSVVDGGKYRIASLLTQQGLAVVSIDQPMHGNRCAPKTLTADQLDVDTFNFFNIVAGLSGFRQSALDTVFLTRMLREGKLDVPVGIGPNGGGMAFGRDNIGFIGHSQGGLSGSLAAAVEPNLRAYVLSGAGAGLSLTVVQRVYPVDFPKMLEGLLSLDPGELSEFHPAVSLVQAMADITDPLAYAALTWQRPAGVRPPDVLLTAGLLDQDTPHLTAEALAAALGLDILAPSVHLNEALQLGAAELLPSPVGGNRKRNGFDVTAVVTQWEKRDHFAIFNEPKLAGMYPNFLRTALTEAVGEVKLP